MSHLFAIAVGPVQEFIAAARRTRDLWFGSYLLSEVSRAVAKSVEDCGGKLIFPASLNTENAEKNAENVANVILAELDSGDPKVIATKAKQAAQNKWKYFAGETWREASDIIRSEIWNDQVDDVIEFYAAWVPHTDQKKYREDRARVMRLLAGRKSCRDFLPAKGRAGVPKSSLDGQRESVLKPPSDWPPRFRARLRIREGEQLDVVGLVKRISGGRRSYPSVARIAAEPWVRGNKHQEPFQIVLNECEKLGADVVHRLSTHVFPQFKDFPYEGTAVFPNRHHEWQEELELNSERLEALNEALKKLPQAEPYLAVIVADGDRMGAAISELESPHSHREFSTALAGFADKAKEIVEQNNGVLVYAGGDDVLAFLPVDQCLSCARELHEVFGSRLSNYGKPTLSVGIAISHFMENLEDLLEYGRIAEKAAKKVEGKDALAIHLRKRGGTPIQVRSKWEQMPDKRLVRLAQRINDGIIPNRLAYDLRAMSHLYERWPNPNTAIQQDLIRLIAQKTSRGESTVRQALSDDISDMNAARLLELAKELLVARMIAGALRQAKTDVEVTA